MDTNDKLSVIWISIVMLVVMSIFVGACRQSEISILESRIGRLELLVKDRIENTDQSTINRNVDSRLDTLFENDSKDTYNNNSVVDRIEELEHLVSRIYWNVADDKQDTITRLRTLEIIVLSPDGFPSDAVIFCASILGLPASADLEGIVNFQACVNQVGEN